MRTGRAFDSEVAFLRPLGSCGIMASGTALEGRQVSPQSHGMCDLLVPVLKAYV